MGRAAAIALLLLTVVAAPACDEEDDNVLFDIGVAIPFFVDASSTSESIDRAPEDPPPFRFLDWEVDRLLLFSGGTPGADLLFGQGPCIFTDSAQTGPGIQGGCDDGVVLEATGSTFTFELVARVDRMRVARALPPVGIDLGPNADPDGDSVRNADDNCPLRPNPGQTDSNFDGLGDDCSLLDPFSGITFPDSDSDGVRDSLDNCLWSANFDQADTTGIGSERGVPDGIGDVCREQVATVFADGSASFELRFPDASLIQPVGGATYLTVDFTEAIACDWDLGRCELDRGAVRFCPSNSNLSLTFGCFF